MRYSGSLVKKEREEIFRMFLGDNKLKFNEIEKKLEIRSNMVSYHLDKMQEEGLLEKKGMYYYLTKEAERYLPILPHITGEGMSPLPVVLVAVIKDERILLIKRKRRPYKGYWSLVGGKMLIEESFEQASKRLVKEKTGLDCQFVSTNAILHEQVKGDEIIKHSFILFFTKVSVETNELKESEHGKPDWFDINKLEKVIPSDEWLILNKLNSKNKITEAVMEEKEGKLTSFNIKNN
ncbi:NUDIX domain-containing protein [Candidatus Woesearchaeota archaeon]|jgi:ADP-ribose pyrophosphatase YjhB (NUDIX family)|nr:NUDIX domain-containing protein [Candidatus Woesearchaeota archaeon]MBT4368587.1 NUDIX domain-containing protein [Candidatus Woesearchaeota archaeon]MBT4713104.1 NUDIX domain-containing protein [Candidatus Woesearchaeota archaeon]MBT6639026.1 NUDIX domain-containing protein [Candidatus Woesearchaeota archaeon]MBT7134225.1 NUDIX domain-containing protein [Candidatus Woesearchaeota archaeon]